MGSLASSRIGCLESSLPLLLLCRLTKREDRYTIRLSFTFLVSRPSSSRLDIGSSPPRRVRTTRSLALRLFSSGTSRQQTTFKKLYTPALIFPSFELRIDPSSKPLAAATRARFELFSALTSLLSPNHHLFFLSSLPCPLQALRTSSSSEEEVSSSPSSLWSSFTDLLSLVLLCTQSSDALPP